MTTAPAFLIIDEDASPSPTATFRVSRDVHYGQAAVKVTDSDGDAVLAFIPAAYHGAADGVIAVRVIASDGDAVTAHAPARLLVDEIRRIAGLGTDPEPLVPPQVVSDEAAEIIAEIRATDPRDRIAYASKAHDGLRVVDMVEDSVRVEPALSVSENAAAYLCTNEETGAYLTAAQARDFAAILTACADRAEGVAL